MPLKVKCTNCEKVLSVPDEARGKAVKCPQCETRIAVPSDDDSSKQKIKSGSSKSKVKKPAKPMDAEEALASMDMRRVEDTEARICPKCGFDMQYQDEEDTECPKCGYDAMAGGLGSKARKKAMKGPDPADFFPGLAKEAWRFVGKNSVLALRTVIYTLISLTIALGCAFMYFWISMWPPRVFLALCFTVSFLVIPGWMWFLDTEVIKLTLERKEKFKRLNFDFFLASAMGAAFVFWSVAVLLPLLAIPAGIGYALVNYSGMPNYVMAICVVIGLIPAIWMLPVVMSHMAMPVQYKGWMVWKLIPMWARNVAPLSIWLLWFVVTNIPNFAGIATIAAVYAPDITDNINIMEDNARIARIKFSREQNPNTKKKGQAAPVLEVLPDPRPYSLRSAIVPGIILVVMSIINGFTSLFNMRTNGQFTYYNKASLELVDRVKEYKYRAKEKRDEDEDEKPKTTVQQAVDGFVFVVVFCLLGLVGGMLYGSLTSAGTTNGIVTGMLIASILGWIVAHILGIKEGFLDSPLWGSLNIIPIIPGFIFVSKNWEYRRTLFFQYLFSLLALVAMIVAAYSVGVLPIQTGDSQPAQAARQSNPMPQQMGNPGQMGMPAPPGMSPTTPNN
jgi:DNA-directed RNA polymerase subunit RPC12/RpoP